jgi:hypothetical protein
LPPQKKVLPLRRLIFHGLKNDFCKLTPVVALVLFSVRGATADTFAELQARSVG